MSRFDDPTPESIADAYAAQQRERREVELATGWVFVGDRLRRPPVVADQVRIGLLVSNAITWAVYGDGARSTAPIALRSERG